MKTTLLILLLGFLSLSSHSQNNQITGMYGIEFGSSKAVVLAKMKARGFIPDENKTSQLSFSKVKFGAFDGSELTFQFINDKFFQGLVFLTPDKEAKIIDLYNELNAELAKKYGKGESYAKFQRPYSEGDGYEISAIKQGKAEYSTFWTKDSSGAIGAKINSGLFIDRKSVV